MYFPESFEDHEYLRPLVAGSVHTLPRTWRDECKYFPRVRAGLYAKSRANAFAAWIG